jgi:hypothetical protein
VGSAKDIVLRPVSAKEANDVVQRVHYSGKIVQNSQFHIGVFYMGKIEGAMQFGPSLDKRKTAGLVSGSGWHQFTELNRMAFSEALPRNSESRALGVAFRLLAKHAPQIKWCISFADGAQCGDGTIYRASGFLLTSIKENNQMWRAPTGEPFARMSLTDLESAQQKRNAAAVISRTTMTKGGHNHTTGAASMKVYAAAGFRPIPGYQFRYVRFIDSAWVDRLTVPVIPFDKIPAECRMYRGQRGGPDGPSGVHPEEGGLTPTPPLHPERADG